MICFVTLLHRQPPGDPNLRFLPRFRFAFSLFRFPKAFVCVVLSSQNIHHVETIHWVSPHSDHICACVGCCTAQLAQELLKYADLSVLSGLAWHTEETTLRQKFEEFGPVEEAVRADFLLFSVTCLRFPSLRFLESRLRETARNSLHWLLMLRSEMFLTS